MFSVDDLELNGQIFVTSLPGCPGALAVPMGPIGPRGVIYANGCTALGNPVQITEIAATLTIAPNSDPGSSKIGGNVGVLKVFGKGSPTDIMLGAERGPIGMTVVGTTVLWTVATTSIKGAVEGKGALTWNGVKLFKGAKEESGAKSDNGAKAQTGAQAKTGAQTDNGPRMTAGPTTGATQIRQDAQIQAAQASGAKGFDIPHPTKKDHRLRYICLEGPEFGAYIRGKLKDSDTIELPDYWSKLVDPESITVNLTPFGHHQELFVEKIEWGTRIKIKNNAGGAINCHYTVFGERVLQDKLQPEYKGLTPEDYPGDNSEYLLGGWDYARHKGEPKSPSL